MSLKDNITPWMQIALNEKKISKDKIDSLEPLHSMVLKYNSLCGANGTPPWCASFISWSLFQSGYKNFIFMKTLDFIKNSYLLKKVKPEYGAIAIFKYFNEDKESLDKYHISFIYGCMKNRKNKDIYLCLGGNQGNRIRIYNYNCSSNITFFYKNRGKKIYVSCLGTFMPKDYKGLKKEVMELTLNDLLINSLKLKKNNFRVSLKK